MVPLKETKGRTEFEHGEDYEFYTGQVESEVPAGTLETGQRHSRNLTQVM